VRPASDPRRRWASFAGVGVMGFGVQVAVLWLLTAGAGLATAAATAIAVEAAVLHNFVWHERWTWRDRARGGRANVLRRLARFHAGAGIVSIVGNVAITVALVEFLHVPATVANTCAVAVLTVLNFRLADQWVFPGHARGSFIARESRDDSVRSTEIPAARDVTRADRSGTTGVRWGAPRRLRILPRVRTPAACRCA
jgi:putative flippase GtrA